MFGKRLSVLLARNEKRRKLAKKVQKWEVKTEIIIIQIPGHFSGQTNHRIFQAVFRMLTIKRREKKNLIPNKISHYLWCMQFKGTPLVLASNISWFSCLRSDVDSYMLPRSLNIISKPDYRCLHYLLSYLYTFFQCTYKIKCLISFSHLLYVCIIHGFTI